MKVSFVTTTIHVPNFLDDIAYNAHINSHKDVNFLIIGDIITIPLYFYKGLTISSIQYLIFLILAILGYISWKKILNKSAQT